MSSSENFAVEKPDEEWRRELAPEAYNVLRAHGTERAGTSPLNDEHRAGLFRCAACGQELFSSDTKFDSGSGWPSFFKPLRARSAPVRTAATSCAAPRCTARAAAATWDMYSPTGRSRPASATA